MLNDIDYDLGRGCAAARCLTQDDDTTAGLGWSEAVHEPRSERM